MTTKDEKTKAMDAASHEAAEAITGDDVAAFKVVARWWASHYLKAGHKRLARVLMEYENTR